jgi:hypothetical protein
LRHRVALLLQQLRAVSGNGENVISVVDDNHVSEPFEPVGIKDPAGQHGSNFCARGCLDFNSVLIVPSELYLIQSPSFFPAIIFLSGNNHLVKDCSISNNGSNGIDIGTGSLVIGNTSFNNGGSGIYITTGCSVKDNTATLNQQFGIFLGGNNLVDGNRSTT